MSSCPVIGDYKCVTFYPYVNTFIQGQGSVTYMYIPTNNYYNALLLYVKQPLMIRWEELVTEMMYA